MTRAIADRYRACAGDRAAKRLRDPVERSDDAVRRCRCGRLLRGAVALCGTGRQAIAAERQRRRRLRGLLEQSADDAADDAAGDRAERSGRTAQRLAERATDRGCNRLAERIAGNLAQRTADSTAQLTLLAAMPRSQRSSVMPTRRSMNRPA